VVSIYSVIRDSLKEVLGEIKIIARKPTNPIFRNNVQNWQKTLDPKAILFSIGSSV
jgi:hypothetical protein